MPRNMERKVDPKPMMAEFQKRSAKREGPAITMPCDRTSLSYHVRAGGRLAIYSDV